MSTSGSPRPTIGGCAAVLAVVALALTGCQTAVSQPGPPREAPAGRPVVIESITPADRAAERIERDRADRGFRAGCRQYVLVEHGRWSVVCVAAR